MWEVQDLAGKRRGAHVRRTPVLCRSKKKKEKVAPWNQAPYVRSSICSGNQINASIGAEMSVTIKNPWGIQHARTHAAATTRRDKARDRVMFIERLFSQRSSFRTTNFKPDHTSVAAHSFMSTKPSGKAVSRIVSSVMSVGTFEDFFGHEIHIVALLRSIFLSSLSSFNAADVFSGFSARRQARPVLDRSKLSD